MLSIKSFSAGQSARGIANYVEQSGAETYYGSGEWAGYGAANMGLAGDLQPGQLEMYLSGRDPRTGAPLTNKVDEEHKPGWDLTFSAPKSASAIWAADPSQRGIVTSAHEAGVKAAMEYLEREAFFTRHGKEGIEQRPVIESGGLIASMHHHAATRAGDPGLHSHLIVANMTADGRSIDFDTRHKMIAGAIYRAEMAYRLREAGYFIGRDGDSFKILGVDQVLIEHWSKRSEEIRERMEERGLTSAESAAAIALETRHDKNSESEREAFNRWECEAAQFGYSTEMVKVAGMVAEQEQMPEIEKIIQERLVNNSTVSDLQLKAAAVVAAQGYLDGRAAQQFYERDVARHESVIRLQSLRGDRITTLEVLAREQGMLERAERMASQERHAITPEQLAASAKWATLRPEQKEVIAHVTMGKDLAVIQGWAGTGKTYAAGAAVEAWKAAGYEVVGASPSNQATKELVAGAGLENAMNTTKLLMELERGNFQLTDKTVLMLDEAGMVGSRQMAEILERAEAAGAKVVLLGDTRQLQSVEAGAAMRGVAERIGSAELGHESVTRQRAEADREIARDIREGRSAEALAKLEGLGRIHTRDNTTEAFKSAAGAYLADRQIGKSTLLIAYTRNEVKQLNDYVRDQLKDRGEIAKDGEKIQTSKGSREFAQGDKIIFGERFYFGLKGDERAAVVNGSRGVVESAKDGVLHVRLDHSKESVRIDTGMYNRIDHGYATTVHKAQGASVETAHLVVGERSSLEWAYVGVTRHKEKTHIHTTKTVIEREVGNDGQQKASTIEKQFAKSEAKDLSTDYVRGDGPTSPSDGPRPPGDGPKPPSPGRDGDQAKGKDQDRAREAQQREIQARVQARENAARVEKARAQTIERQAQRKQVIQRQAKDSSRSAGRDGGRGR
jgi:conjugative relaxase-like TrwC/TraI family protein